MVLVLDCRTRRFRAAVHQLSLQMGVDDSRQFIVEPDLLHVSFVETPELLIHGRGVQQGVFFAFDQLWKRMGGPA